MRYGFSWWAIQSLFCLGVAGVASAQEIKVIDKTTRQPIENVYIYADSGNFFTNTDAQGTADLKRFAIENIINFQHPAYHPLFVQFDHLSALNFIIPLEEKVHEIEEVVISASRWKQKKRSVPNHISSIEASQIALQSPQTAADLLNISGDVYIQKSQMGGGSPMIRGFAANRLLIAVDGIRMNNAIFRSGNLQNVISLDPFAIQNTEVIFGPGSVMYGSDAIGGVMSFYTLEPMLTNDDDVFISGKAVSRYASANFEKTVHLDFNIGLKKWGFITSVSFSDFDDQKMGKNGPGEYLRSEYVKEFNGSDSIIVNSAPRVQVGTGYSQLNLMQKIRFRPDKNWEVNYGFHYATTSDVPRYDRLIQYGQNGQLRSATWYYGPQVWGMNNLTFTYSRKAKVFDKAKLSLAHQLFKESRHNRAIYSTTLKNRAEKVNAVSVNLDLEKQDGEKGHFYYGVEAVVNYVNSEGNDFNIETGEKKPAGSRYPDGSSWASYAAYLTYGRQINKQVSVQAGMRYNRIKIAAFFDTTFYPFPFKEAKVNTSAFTGNVGLVYNADNAWQISANLSSAFRAPNIDDIGKVFDSAPGIVVVPNPTLEAEYAYNGEISIAKKVQGCLQFSLTGYYTFLEQALSRRRYELNGQDSLVYDGVLSQVQAIQNIASAHVYGLQAGLECTLPLGFAVTSRLNVQRGQEELEDGTEAPLRHAAPLFGSTHLTYTYKQIKIDLYSTYNGEISNDALAPEEQVKAYLYAVDNNGKPYSPRWYTLNLKALMEVNKHLHISAGLENITNQRYRPYSSGIAAPGRNLILSLKGIF